MTLAVLVVVGGSILLLAPSGSGDGDMAADAATERFPIASYVPGSVSTVEAGYALRDPSDPRFVQAVVARSTADGFSDAVFVVVVDSADISRYEGDESVEVNGHPATLMRSGGIGIWWEQGGGAVWVHAADEGLALAVAEAVIVADAESFSADVLRFGRLPDGFTVFAPPALGPTEDEPYVSMLGEWAPGRNPLTVNITTSSQSVEHMLGGARSGTATTIRGHDAYRIGYTDGEATIVGFIWAETDDLTIDVRGTYPEDEIRKIAESIDLVAEAEWRDHYDVQDSTLELPTTTTTTLSG